MARKDTPTSIDGQTRSMMNKDLERLAREAVEAVPDADERARLFAGLLEEASRRNERRSAARAVACRIDWVADYHGIPITTQPGEGVVVIRDAHGEPLPLGVREQLLRSVTKNASREERRLVRLDFEDRAAAPEGDDSVGVE